MLAGFYSKKNSAEGSSRLDGAPSDREFQYHGRRYLYDSIRRYIGYR